MADVDAPDDSVTTLAYQDEPLMSLQLGEVPTWLDYQAVVDYRADDGVAAPEQFVDGLRSVVSDAADRGLDLKIVYTEAPAAVYTTERRPSTNCSGAATPSSARSSPTAW